MLEQIWEKLKKRLIRNLLTDPHTAFLRNGFSGIVIKLKLESKLDGRLFVESRIIHRTIRLITRTSFRALEGEWTEPEGAIIDTGSHISVIPHYIWTNAHHSFISDKTEMGIGGNIVSGRLGWVTLRLAVYFVNYPSALQVKASIGKGSCQQRGGRMKGEYDLSILLAPMPTGVGA